ncbi:MAG: twin-arginine translocase TatA/TatE family subunit [Acidobacteriota bacterium]|jgi:TatA/E family protein of Tat protein translocase
MFGTLGMPELILIFVVALLLFGPRKMPEIGRSIGRALGEFRRASNEFKRTIEDEVAAEEIREVEKDLKGIKKTVNEPLKVDLAAEAPPPEKTKTEETESDGQ